MKISLSNFLTPALIFSFGMVCVVGQASALTYEITEPCSTELAVKGGYELPITPMSIGAATILILDSENLPYVGSDRGFNSILNTPVGQRSLEIISDSEMRSYGWCYEVNGRVPDDLASQYLLKGPEHIRWFYGVATFKDGEWTSFCKPTDATVHRRHCQ